MSRLSDWFYKHESLPDKDITGAEAVLTHCILTKGEFDADDVEFLESKAGLKIETFTAALVGEIKKLRKRVHPLPETA